MMLPPIHSPTHTKAPLQRRVTSPALLDSTHPSSSSSKTIQRTQSLSRDDSSLSNEQQNPGRNRRLRRKETRLALVSEEQKEPPRFTRTNTTGESKKNKKKIASRFKEKGEAKRFFRTYVRRVTILLVWFKSFLEREEELKKYIKAMTELAREVEEETAQWRLKQQGVFFDKNNFKARKELALSQEVVDTLTSPPMLRSQAMIKEAMKSLQRVCHQFAEYPDLMQEKLVQVSWLQAVAPNKIILREGHSPDNFYFIISGTAVVMKAKFDHQSLNTEFKNVAKLKKGQCFGEIALIYNVTRTASVHSMTEMQLLSIQKNDFFQIFLHRSLDNKSEPNHIRFCRSLDFLQGWPVDLLLQEEEKCIYNFFRTGIIIVNDSITNNWIYIVKAGTCQVLKKLRAVKNKARPKADAELEFITQGNERKLSNISKSMLRSRSLVGKTPVQLEKAKTAYMDNLQRSKTDTTLNTQKKEMEISKSFAELLDTAPKGDSSHIFEKVKRKTFQEKLQRKKSMPHSIVEIDEEVDEEEEEKFIPIDTPAARSPSPRQSFQNLFNVNKAIRTMRQYDKRPFTYVSLGILGPRDVFGLESIQFGDDIETTKTSMVLVSRGAEVIMIRKDFFIEHSNASVKEYFRKKVRPYPTDGTLQESLETEIYWSQYKQDIYKKIIGVKDEIKSLKTINLLA